MGVNINKKINKNEMNIVNTDSGIFVVRNKK